MSPFTGRFLYMLAHADIHGNYMLSFDIEKHHEEDGILEQRDEFDEYLADVQPCLQ